MTTEAKRLLFSIEKDNIGTSSWLHLYVGENLIIPFKDTDEWKKFADDMLGMLPEITENLESGNY